MKTAKQTVTVICPVHNEAPNLPVFHKRLTEALSRFEADLHWELLFINNDSSDETLAVLNELRTQDPKIEIVTHARNFGYQASVLCGLVHATGDATVIIDADCEDPPEMLATFIEHWRQGYDIVYGIRADRPEHAAIKAMRKLFYRLTHHIADWEFIIDMAEFSLFTRRVREQVLRVSSTFPFIRSELAYVGFKRIGIPYARQPRLYGTTHYNIIRMTQFAVAGILSASTFPLRLVVYLGAILVPLNLLALLFLADAHLMRLLVLDAAVGLLAAAALSTYVSRIYKDSVGRPAFIVDRERTTLKPERLFDPKRSRVTS